MNQERVLKIILAPVVSEKSSTIQMYQQYAFKVLIDATKHEIKNAVEQLFKVKVEHVRVVSVHGKQKKHAGRIGRRSSWKKAYVRLAEGNAIELASMSA